MRKDTAEHSAPDDSYAWEERALIGFQSSHLIRLRILQRRREAMIFIFLPSLLLFLPHYFSFSHLLSSVLSSQEQHTNYCQLQSSGRCFCTGQLSSRRQGHHLPKNLLLFYSQGCKLEFLPETNHPVVTQRAITIC